MNTKKSDLVKPILEFIPEEIAQLTFTCNSCGNIFSPDWFSPKEFPVIPIEVEGGSWVPGTTNELCPNCKKLVSIKLPHKKVIGSVYLFGDEAFRSLTNRNDVILYTYSLIGTSKPLLGQVNDQIITLKSNLIPEIAPDSWSIHMKSIWSGDERKKYAHLLSWSKDKTTALLEGVKNIFCNNENCLFKFNILFIAKQFEFNSKINLEHYVRNEVYTALIKFVIDSITSLTARPIIYFDSQKNSVSDITIHQWARDSFRSTQSALMYPFISKGITIPEPKFVHPATMPLLELADVMSFLVARYHHSTHLNKKESIDLQLLGETNYLTVEHKTGDLIFKRSKYYPWQMKYT